MRIHSANARSVRATAGLIGAFVGSNLASYASTGIDRTVLPIALPPFAGDAEPRPADSRPQPMPSVSAPEGAPNMLVVLLDDAGFGQSGTFGGLVPTPTLDGLASRGLRFTRFHVTAMCSPSRAALLTGRNHHAVGMGTIANWSSDYPGYSTSIPRSAAMVSRILQENGYATAAFGKWHLIPNVETTQAGPFDHWPTHQGFGYYYGFLGGETDQWHPEITEGTLAREMEVPKGREGDYTLNDSLADHAIAWIRAEKSYAPRRPFFIYYAPGATHAPLQAPKSWINRFKGQFDMGWDAYREQVLARQKAMGIVPADTRLTPRPPEIPAWDSLSPDQKRLDARLMEVFAGFMAQSDDDLGRVVGAIRDVGALDNTLIVFVAGDNGASLEGGPQGTTNLIAGVNGIQVPTVQMLSQLDSLGGADTTPFYPAGWGWAGNTPFQWGKRIASSLGGTRDPLVISWPARIHDRNGIRTQFHHLIDIAPTLLEAAQIPAPKSVDGILQQPMDGVSMVYSFDSAAVAGRRTTQYFEMLGNRGIYSDGWIAGARSGQLPWSFRANADPLAQPWELYHIDADFSEAENLAAQEPERLGKLQRLFDEEARRNHVYPINGRLAGRHSRADEPTVGPASYTYYAGANHIYNATAPAVENRSFAISAQIDVPREGADGVILAFGGAPCGFSLYLRENRPIFVYNYFRLHMATLKATEALPPGPAVVGMTFAYDGGGTGKGATITLQVNGRDVGSLRLAQTVPVEYSYDETLDVGEDDATPVGDYASPFRFTGNLKRVDLVVQPAAPAVALGGDYQEKILHARDLEE